MNTTIVQPLPSLAESVMRDVVRMAVANAPSLRAFARSAGVSAAYVSDVLAGKRGVGPKLAAHFGYRVRKVTSLVYDPA